MKSFKEMYEKDVSAYVEKKNNLTYLSWANAWLEFKLAYPDAEYTIKHWDGKPYLADEFLGYMVETSITANGQTHVMWLPVMDGANKAMKSVAYNVPSRYGEKTVLPATMFDINTAIMRCLTKNMAMFGLGLYIYAGEDIPKSLEESEAEPEQKKQPVKKEEKKQEPAEEKTPEAKPDKNEELTEYQEKVRNNLIRLYNAHVPEFDTPEKVKTFLRDKSGIRKVERVDDIKKLETLKAINEMLTKKEA